MNQTKGLHFVRFPGKQGSFSINVYTVCWSMWSEVPMQMSHTQTSYKINKNIELIFKLNIPPLAARFRARCCGYAYRSGEEMILIGQFFAVGSLRIGAPPCWDLFVFLLNLQRLMDRFSAATTTNLGAKAGSSVVRTPYICK